MRTHHALGWTVALGLSISSIALADPPQINNITPYGVQRGVATEVTINGGNLTGNPRIIAPIPLNVEPPAEPNKDAGNWKLKLVVPSEVTVGVYPIRVQTDDGISNPFLLAVGQWPQVTETEPNNTFEAAQAVGSPVVVEGQASGNDVDYFKFPGKKGQKIVVDAQCSRIGSGVDPQIRVLTADRKFVASADDTAGLMTDARLTTVLPDDGDYVVEISDSKYQGTGRAVYRLELGPLPMVEEVYPLGARRGETVGFELRGGTLPDPGLKVAAATVSVPPLVDSFRLPVTNQALGLVGPSDPVVEVETPGPIEVGDLPELREPSQADAPPLRAAPPVTLNGRIDPAGDEDRFTLAVTPGQKYSIQVHAADLGSALDGVLQVLNDKGAGVANADDTTLPPAGARGQKKKVPGMLSPDPSLEFTVPGGVNEITLVLNDLEGRGGIGYPYRITVEPVTPSFEVVLNDAQVSVPKGGTATIPVTVARQGFNGPVTLTVADPPAGLTVRQGAVTDGQSLGVLSVSAAPDAAFGAVDLKVIGTAQGPNGPITETATRQNIFAQQANLPTNIATQVGLPAAPMQPRPVSIEAPEGPVEVVHGYGATVPLKVNRAEKAEAGLSITPLPMPPGLAVPELKIADKTNEGNATINAAPEAPLGKTTIALSAKGKFDNKDQVFAVPAITIDVVRPAALELASPNLEIKPGQTVEVKGKVVRKGPFQEPVNVQIKGLPGGLKADPVTVAPDAAEFTIKVVADEKAEAATASAQVAMAFQINKKDYNTPATALAVKVVK